jgi:hypothetical protein
VLKVVQLRAYASINFSPVVAFTPKSRPFTWIQFGLCVPTAKINKEKYRVKVKNTAANENKTAMKLFRNAQWRYCITILFGFIPKNLQRFLCSVEVSSYIPNLVVIPRALAACESVPWRVFAYKARNN